MKIACKWLAIAGAAAMLSGCQTVGGVDSFGTNSGRAELTRLDMSEYFDRRLETGRMHLLEKRPSRAVVAYRQAAYDPGHAAAAFNGMAVAYAQMGRLDLAHRFFSQALTINPSDARSLRNLARLEASVEGAQLRQAQRADPASMKGVPSNKMDAVRTARSSEQQQFAGTGMIRLSSYEVHLTSSSVAASSTPIGRARPEVRIATRRTAERVARPILAQVRNDRVANFRVRTIPARVR